MAQISLLYFDNVKVRIKGTNYFVNNDFVGWGKLVKTQNCKNLNS